MSSFAFKKLRVTIALGQKGLNFDDKNNTIVAENLRVSATIQSGNGAIQPNAKIMIYGLSQNVMNRIAKISWNIKQEKLNSDAKISISIGASKSVSTSHTKQTTHQGSELSAGSVTVRATEGDNTIVGSKVDAKEVALEGKNINLLGTTDTQSNRSDNKSSSWSVGVFVGKSGGSNGVRY
ncbi:hemagglutinin repeat-containing protein [Glaesserella parasuis]|nr:hemagglutinin repeat-containing protein [Glaesserella parasuis]